MYSAACGGNRLDPCAVLRRVRRRSSSEARVRFRRSRRQTFDQDTPASTGGLEKAFEITSGQDLTAFFDQWVDNGFIPAFSGEWSANSVTVRSDIPFGTIEVPVTAIHSDGSTESLWLAVTDGVGTLKFAKPATRVILDPEELVPATSRKLFARK